MKKNNTLVTIKGNKYTNVNVNINNPDELSCDNIKRQYNNVAMLEEEFTDRIEYSKDVLTKKLLPKQLQSDFNIIPKLRDGKMEFEAKSITPDAYDKFPLKFTYTMQFKDIEEAKQFREHGIEKLQMQANKLQQPVEVPNILNMKEFLGDFENPVAYSTKYGSEGIKLYICPRPLPPAQKYSIEIFNDNFTFKIITLLRLSNYDDNDLILSNNGSIDEPYEVILKLSDFKKIEHNKQFEGRFNITIALREKYRDNCEFNKEIIKYGFLIEDRNNHILIENVDETQQIFNFENCGKKKYKKREYTNFKNIVELIDKVIYISKIKNIKVKFDLQEFIKNDELINLIYNEVNNKNYIIKKNMVLSQKFTKKANFENLYKCDGNFMLGYNLEHVTLFGEKIMLKANETIMHNCIIKEVINNKDFKIVKFESSHIEFKLL